MKNIVKNIMAIIILSPLMANNQNGIHLLFPDNFKEIDSIVGLQIESSRQKILNIIDTNKKTFENQFVALDLTYAQFKSNMAILEILTNLHPDIKVQNRSFSGLMHLQNNFHNIFLENDKLYQSLLDYRVQNKEQLNSEEEHTAIETILELMKHGLHLSINEKASITLDNREKDFLTNRFFSNLSNYQIFYNKIVNCKDSNERKKIWKNFHNNNSEILNEDFAQILKLKNNIAKTANFLNSNESELLLKPLNNIESIKNYLDNIVDIVQKIIFQEIKDLKEINNNQIINPWDLDYLLNKYQQEKFKPIKFENILSKILDFWQTKLNIKIEKTTTKLWNQDITLLTVHKDMATESILGYSNTFRFTKTSSTPFTILIDAFARKNKKQENKLKIINPKIFFITADINSTDQLLNSDQAKSLFKNIGHGMLLSNQQIQLPGNVLNIQHNTIWQINDYMLEELFYVQLASRKFSVAQLLLQNICNAYICLNNDKLSRKNNAIKIYNKIVKEVYIKFGIDKILLTDENLEFNHNLHLAITKGASCYTSIYASIKQLVNL